MTVRWGLPVGRPHLSSCDLDLHRLHRDGAGGRVELGPPPVRRRSFVVVSRAPGMWRVLMTTNPTGLRGANPTSVVATPRFRSSSVMSLDPAPPTGRRAMPARPVARVRRSPQRPAGGGSGSQCEDRTRRHLRPTCSMVSMLGRLTAADPAPGTRPSAGAPKAWIFAATAVGYLPSPLPPPRAGRGDAADGDPHDHLLGSFSIWAAGGAALGRILDDERTRRAVAILLAGSDHRDLGTGSDRRPETPSWEHSAAPHRRSTTGGMRRD